MDDDDDSTKRNICSVRHLLFSFLFLHRQISIYKYQEHCIPTQPMSVEPTVSVGEL